MIGESKNRPVGTISRWQGRSVSVYKKLSSILPTHFMNIWREESEGRLIDSGTRALATAYGVFPHPYYSGSIPMLTVTSRSQGILPFMCSYSVLLSLSLHNYKSSIGPILKWVYSFIYTKPSSISVTRETLSCWPWNPRSRSGNANCQSVSRKSSSETYGSMEEIP
jgi:hypothetical protein